MNANNDARKNELSKDLWIKYGGYADIDETIPYVDWDGIAEEILERERKIVDEINQYTQHDSKCLCSQFRAGQPTKDGGYETLYGYGSNERWYQRGEEPVCSCGLNDIIKRAGLNS